MNHQDFESSVDNLIAIEPSSGMRSIFGKQNKDDRVSVADGTFDNTHLKDQSADAVIVAQAWHWCPDYDAAVREISRILKPDGVAFFIWNLEE